MNDLIQNFAVYALPVLFAITLHEAAHAYAAKYFGDLTAYSQGRMSLNPANHIDPFGTILLPMLLYFIKSPFLLGYAKPVPIDFSRLRRPKQDMVWVASAGPFANLLMGLIWHVLGLFLIPLHVSEPFFFAMAKAGVEVNLIFFAFNLFPLPPLDGGRVLTGLLPHKYAYKFAQIEPYGFFILLALLYFQRIIVDFWIVPISTLGANLIFFIAKPFSLFLS